MLLGQLAGELTLGECNLTVSNECGFKLASVCVLDKCLNLWSVASELLTDSLHGWNCGPLEFIPDTLNGSYSACICSVACHIVHNIDSICDCIRLSCNNNL